MQPLTSQRSADPNSLPLPPANNTDGSRSGLLRRTSSTQRPGHSSTSGQQPKRSASADRAAWAHLPSARPRDKVVQLPAVKQAPLHEALQEDDEESLLLDEGLTEQAGARGSITSPQGDRGRITVVTPCSAFKRSEVIRIVSLAMPRATVEKYAEVVYIQTPFSSEVGGGSGDVFVFDYGCVIMWALNTSQETELLRMLLPCQVKPLLPQDVQKEDLSFQYSKDQPPSIKNDLITISAHEAKDHSVKMAISHALAQSCKLSVYEERVWELVEKVRYMPEALARDGEIHMSQKQMAQLMGAVFLQKSEVNLLSSVLDTPDFFWSAPDALQVLYDKVTEYLDLQARIEIVNSRTKLIQNMLGIWSDHASHHQLYRLDRIIILLIVIEVLMAAAEVVGYFLQRKAV